MMLFGASIETCPNNTYRMRVQRNKKSWPALGFLVTVIESQDPLFEFLTFRMQSIKGMHLVARTRPSQFLGVSHQRWYLGGDRQMPTDLKLDEAALAFWLLGNWGPQIVLPAFGGITSSQAACIPWDYVSNALDGDLKIVDADKEKVEAWLHERMPDKFWRQDIEQHSRGNMKRP